MRHNFTPYYMVLLDTKRQGGYFKDNAFADLGDMGSH